MAETRLFSLVTLPTEKGGYTMKKTVMITGASQESVWKRRLFFLKRLECDRNNAEPGSRKTKLHEKKLDLQHLVLWIRIIKKVVQYAWINTAGSMFWSIMPGMLSAGPFDCQSPRR